MLLFKKKNIHKPPLVFCLGPRFANKLKIIRGVSFTSEPAQMNFWASVPFKNIYINFNPVQLFALGSNVLLGWWWWWWCWGWWWRRRRGEGQQQQQPTWHTQWTCSRLGAWAGCGFRGVTSVSARRSHSWDHRPVREFIHVVCNFLGEAILFQKKKRKRKKAPQKITSGMCHELATEALSPLNLWDNQFEKNK